MQTDTAQENISMEQALFKEEVQVCDHCGNIYKVVHFKNGDDWNDFGFRHCPFCGGLTEEYANIGKT